MKFAMTFSVSKSNYLRKRGPLPPIWSVIITIIIIMEAQIDLIYDTLLRVETEADSRPLLAWLENVCQPQF